MVLFAQERHPELYDIGTAELVRPDIGGILPVFVLDRYEGLDARLLRDLTRAERERYVELNAAALREHLPADLVFANHVLLGGPVAAATGARYRVKAHGSELEYSMRGNEELSKWGRESLARAEAVFVGSEHIREVLEDVVGHVDRVHEVPPGVDVDEFRPLPRAQALAQLLVEARDDPPNSGNANERLPDEGNAQRFAEFFAQPGPTIVYFGKLIYNKGVQVLLEALDGLDAKAVIVGFGDYRGELESARAGTRALHGAARASPPRAAAAALRRRRRAVDLPEAFGMVAAEAAAAGVPPLVARHSGLAEVAEGLEAAYPRSAPRSRASRTATSRSCATSSPRCSPCPEEERAASVRPHAARSWSAGAGRAWRNGFSRQ